MAKFKPSHLAPTSKLDGRIIALDILRGYFILVIASIHLGYVPSLLATFDGRGQLWFSEAECFFFISGMLIGIIRRKDFVRSGFATVARKIWKRALKIYAASIVLTLAFVALGRALTILQIHGVKSGLDTGSSWLHIIHQSVTLQYSYGWTDFLIYYSAYLFIAPLVLYLLTKGYWWIVILIVSELWIFHWMNFGLPHWVGPFAQWQAAFFIGLVIGYYWDAINSRLQRLSVFGRRRLASALIATSALIYLSSMVFVLLAARLERMPDSVPQWAHGIVQFILSTSHNYSYNRLLVDGRNGLLRPIVLLLFMAGLYALVRRYEERITRYAGWLLLPFGQNSLYVYILQGILLFSIPIFFARGSFITNTLIELGMTALVWLALRYRFLFRVIPR